MEAKIIGSEKVGEKETLLTTRDEMLQIVSQDPFLYLPAGHR
jgi:hypothetical protein